MGAHGPQLPRLGRSPLALRVPVHSQGAEVICAFMRKQIVVCRVPEGGVPMGAHPMNTGVTYTVRLIQKGLTILPTIISRFRQ